MTGILFNGCEPGGYRNRAGWLPKYAWPAEARMQFGEAGVVFDSKNRTTYMTAFVEVFMEVPDPTFLRGEGETVDAAEADAWLRLESWRACEHDWVRRDGGKVGSRDTCGRCTKCHQVQTRLFPPLTWCAVCGKQSDAHMDRYDRMLCEEHGNWRALPRELWRDAQWLQCMKDLKDLMICDMLGLEEEVYAFLHRPFYRPDDIPGELEMWREKMGRATAGEATP